MTARQDEVRKLKAHQPPPLQRLAGLREAGMHCIRFQLVLRLLRAALREDTLTIFWDHDAAFMREKGMGEASWRLVAGRGRRAGAEFPDLWVLCYPDDAEIKRAVEAALDRMVEEVRRQAADDPRARDPRPQTDRLKPAGHPRDHRV